MINDTYDLLELFDYDYNVTAKFLIFIGAPYARGRIIKNLENLKVQHLIYYINYALDLPYSAIKFFKEHTK